MEIQSEIEARRRQAAHILTRLREVLPFVLAEYPVDAAYVYGSVARGTVTPFSDVDIALLLSKVLSPHERLMLELEIQGAVEDASRLGPVDVRIINQAPLLVRGKIVQEGVCLFEGDRARRVAFEAQTRQHYFDFAPAVRRLQAAFLDRIHREGLFHG